MLWSLLPIIINIKSIIAKLVIIYDHYDNHIDHIYHHKPLHDLCRKHNLGDFNRMVDEGVVSDSLLSSLLSETPYIENAIRELMLELNLMTPISGKGGYLVPSLLPVDPTVTMESLRSIRPRSAQKSRFSLAFFSSFESERLVHKLNSISGISLDELRASSFVPHSLFVRFLCRAISWAQDTGNDIQVSISSYFRNAVRLIYGNQVFRVIFNEWIGVLEVEVEGNNPISVHNRLVEQFSKILEQYFPNLMMATTLSVQFSSSLV